MLRKLLPMTLLLANAPQAQVTAPTEADEAKVPTAFSSRNTQGPAAFAARGTPQGYTPNPDLRDYTGSYVSVSGGPPGGGPGGGAGGGPGAGGPPGGAPPGGAPGGMGGGDAASANRESCVPSFGGGAYATHVVSSTGRVTVIGEENHRLRRIEIGGTHPKDVKPTYAASSVAQWDGNTLVIDTIAIRGQDGTHLVERWTRQSDGSIDIATTTLDASGKAQSTRTSKLVWRPDITYVENICEDFGEAFGESYRQRLAR